MSKIRNLLLILMVAALFGTVYWIRSLSTDMPQLETATEEPSTAEITANESTADEATQSEDSSSADGDEEPSASNETSPNDSAMTENTDENASIETIIEPPVTPEELDLAQWENPFVEVIGGEATLLNPILSIDLTAQAVAKKIFPVLLGQDPETGALVPNELAQDWSVSDDGLVYTFELQDDVTWSDGEPVTAYDIKFTYDAMAVDSIQSPLSTAVQELEKVEVLGDYEIAVTLAGRQCTFLQILNYPILPSHLYADDFSDFLSNPQTLEPTVGAGPFVFAQRDSNTIVLARNESYWRGAPNMDAWVYEIVPDAEDRWQLVADSDADLVQLEPGQLAEISPDSDLPITFHQAQSDSFNFIALNLADPMQAESGQDGVGERVEQAPHPILGDKNVRLAIAQALDYEQILEQVYKGQAYPLASYVLPISWAYDDTLEPYAYDPETAAELLEDAGWLEGDDGIREKDGEPLRLTLLTNEDNAQRTLLGDTVQEQLLPLGIEIDFQPLGFGEMVNIFLGQTYDMVILGWENLGPDPGNSQFWSSESDVIGAGFNTTSYQNASVDDWLVQALEIPGCDTETRAQIYRSVQERIYEDQPYIIVGGTLDTWAYADHWQGIEPSPWIFDHNLHEWE